ncbi:hypothetical protein KFL_004750120 [Klebsormidium nitens]|uniref:FMR1-interacting protein 1 conserved domain-containing protein n=1 Tax=Klebsormidium nitens TaxID=105231 RepID=A0A1Y1IEE8_KLENI|nr:hypothetical protein KFL_004750120 [Klebsormidium nitens]|eukprot:GAQ88983.1 hypothetical protein KFL_004750120 [Klebsormidium nitens]
MANFWPGPAAHFSPQGPVRPPNSQNPQPLVQQPPQRFVTFQGQAQSSLGQERLFGQAQGFGQPQGFGLPHETGHVAASGHVGGFAQPLAFGQGLGIGQAAYGQVQQGCLPGHLTGHAMQAQQTGKNFPENQCGGQLLVVNPLAVAQPATPNHFVSVQTGTVFPNPGTNTPVQNAPMLGNPGQLLQLQPGVVLPNPGQGLPVQGINVFPNVYQAFAGQAQTPFSFPVAGPRPVTPPNSHLVAALGKPSPILPSSSSFPQRPVQPNSPFQRAVGGSFPGHATPQEQPPSTLTVRRPWQQRWRGMGKQCEEPGCNFFGGRKAMAKHRFHNHDEVPTPPKAPVSKEAGEKALRWREDRKKCFPTGANIQKKLAEGAARLARGELDLEVDSRKRRRHLRQLVSRGQQLGVPVPAGLERFLEDDATGGKPRGAKEDRAAGGAALDWETFFGRVLKAEEGAENGGAEEGELGEEREMLEGQKKGKKGKSSRNRKTREAADEDGKRVPKREAGP